MPLFLKRYVLLVEAASRRAGVKGLWAPVLGTICVGVSLELPLFLYLREHARARG